MKIPGWCQIETAPKDRYILIRDGNLVPDLVRWRDRRPERIINGNRMLSIPAGWFSRSGSRSDILGPTHWTPIP